MAGYTGQIIQMATTLNRGVINDHLDVSPDFNSDFKAEAMHNTRLRLYSGFIRKDFRVTDGPVPNLGPEAAAEHPRNYQRTSIKFRDLPLEKALQHAREIALREGLVLYLEREFKREFPSPCNREIVWHPDGWQPHEG